MRLERLTYNNKVGQSETRYGRAIPYGKCDLAYIIHGMMIDGIQHYVEKKQEKN